VDAWQAAVVWEVTRRRKSVLLAPAPPGVVVHWPMELPLQVEYPAKKLAGTVAI
jgi:hypothetical protein